MALPNDMQVVPVILLKNDVRRIDKLAGSLRQSRSEFLRNLIADGLVAFSLSDCLSEDTDNTLENQPQPVNA